MRLKLLFEWAEVVGDYCCVQFRNFDWITIYKNIIKELFLYFDLIKRDNFSKIIRNS